MWWGTLAVDLLCLVRWRGNIIRLTANFDPKFADFRRQQGFAVILSSMEGPLSQRPRIEGSSRGCKKTWGRGEGRGVTRRCVVGCRRGLGGAVGDPGGGYVWRGF